MRVISPLLSPMMIKHGPSTAAGRVASAARPGGSSCAAANFRNIFWRSHGIPGRRTWPCTQRSGAIAAGSCTERRGRGPCQRGRGRSRRQVQRGAGLSSASASAGVPAAGINSNEPAKHYASHTSSEPVEIDAPVVRGYDFNGGIDYPAILKSLYTTGYQVRQTAALVLFSCTRPRASARPLRR